MLPFTARVAKLLTGQMRCFAFCVLLVFASFAPSAQACFGIRVTHLGDDRNDTNGTCNLREAIRASNGNVAVDACPAGSSTATDRVCLPAATYTIDLSTGGLPESPLVGDLDITGSLELVGVGADVTKVVGTNGSGDPLLSILNTAGNVFIRGVTLEQTSLSGGVLLNTLSAPVGFPVFVIDSVIRGGRAGGGGGILNSAGGIQIHGSRIEANRATNSGGGLLNDGGTVSLNGSDVVGNEAGSDGGGIATSNAGKVFVYRSRIADNRALSGRGGGFFAATDFDVQYTEFRANRAAMGAGFHLATGMGEINRSAFIGNIATATGGGVNAQASLAVRFTTFTENVAGQGGAVYANAPQVLLDADTLARNSGGGGLHNQLGAFLENVLIALNAGGNCVGTPPAFGAYNLEDVNQCGFVNDPGNNKPNFPNTLPRLGALADNGGPTPTIALLLGSPAIDAVSSVIRTNCQLMLDQRGYPRGRPRANVGGTDVFRCDIGAYELSRPFIVDTGVDGVDADPADDRCATATGTCTLRAAVQQANATPGFDVIELAARQHSLSLAGGAENLGATGDLDLRAELLIRGAGSALTRISGDAIDRVLDVPVEIESPVNGFILQDLRIDAGFPPAGEKGAGMRSVEPKVRLERVVVTGNAVRVGDEGAALYLSDPAPGQRRIKRTLELVDSAVFLNVGNMPIYASEALIQRSAIHANMQRDRGSEFVAVRVENSTFSGNGGGTWSAFFSNRAFIDASTLFGNTVTTAPGAVFLLELSAFRNTIIAGNLVNGLVVENCSMNPDSIQSLGHNLTDTSGVDCGLTGLTDLRLAQPLLGPLANNGGPTLTHALQTGSPAIDAGDLAACQAVDQRRFVRPADGDGDTIEECDIGAFELFALSDLDGDGLIDGSDNCPFFANANQLDTDTDGRGDACECTDQNGDGRNTVNDLVAINGAIFNPALVTPLCDGNLDRLCTVADIVAANAEIFSPTSTSTCARQPQPGP